MQLETKLSPAFVRNLEAWLLDNLPPSWQSRVDDIAASVEDALAVQSIHSGRSVLELVSDAGERVDAGTNLSIGTHNGVPALILPVARIPDVLLGIPGASMTTFQRALLNLCARYAHSGQPALDTVPPSNTSHPSVALPPDAHESATHCEASPQRHPGGVSNIDMTHNSSEHGRTAAAGPLCVPRDAVFVPYTESPLYNNGRTLRSYQVAGLNWLLTRWHSHTNAILADEMGLGKTAQTVCFLEHLNRVHGLRGPFLVVVPLSTIHHWQREVETWTNLVVCMYRDSAAARAVIRDWEWYFPGVSTSVARFSVSTAHTAHCVRWLCRRDPSNF